MAPKLLKLDLLPAQEPKTAPALLAGLQTKMVELEKSYEPGHVIINIKDPQVSFKKLEAPCDFDVTDTRQWSRTQGQVYKCSVGWWPILPGDSKQPQWSWSEQAYLRCKLMRATAPFNYHNHFVCSLLAQLFEAGPAGFVQPKWLHIHHRVSLRSNILGALQLLTAQQPLASLQPLHCMLMHCSSHALQLS